jgi:hypothetical protein
MTARIHRGFHRLGLVAALICFFPSAMALGVWLLDRAKPEGLLTGGIWVIAGLGCYLFARVLGWVVAGFAGDGD